MSKTSDNRVWCAWHRDGWCASKSQPKRLRYADNIPTACGAFVICTGGIERRVPTCAECLAALNSTRKDTPK